MSDPSSALTVALVTRIIALIESKTTWGIITTYLLHWATEQGYTIDPNFANSLTNWLLNTGILIGTVLTIYLHQKSKQAISKAIATPADGADQ